MIKHLVIVDPQNDFCREDGALSVPNAMADIDRLIGGLSEWSDLKTLTVTMDWHSPNHCGHLGFWGPIAKDLKPFEQYDFVQLRELFKNYEKDLPSSVGTRISKFLSLMKSDQKHTIWPRHCIAGTFGSMIEPSLAEAIDRYLARNPDTEYNVLTKGNNIYYEEYSWFGRVSRGMTTISGAKPGMPVWLHNRTIGKDDVVHVVGQALTHCVCSSAKDLNDLGIRTQIIEGMTSPIPGFESNLDVLDKSMNVIAPL